MKIKTIIRLLTVATLLLFVIPSCVKEGPPGLPGADGADGTDGADGQVTCLSCHGTGNIEAKQAEFALSEHSIGEVREGRESWSSSCVQCHIPSGFVEFAETGEVIGTITNSERWACNTCHGLHQTFEATDYALRLTDPVVLAYDNSMTMDLGGNSNLCGNCHQARTAEPNTASPGETFRISSTHYGPHHGPQGNIVYGIGLAEIAGSHSYPTAGASTHLSQASCVGCHMYPQSDATGGHTWWPNKSACNACHSGSDLTDDYDYKGFQTQVQGKLDELRDKLETAGVVEYIAADDAWEPVVGTYSMLEAQAYFNWIGITEDRSKGAHNPDYVWAILENTIEALDAAN